MATQADEFRALMDGMRAEYCADLPARMRALSLLWQGLDGLPAATSDGAPLAARLAELRRLAHTLAGSARTFGLPQVTDAARELEQAFVAALQDPAVLGSGTPDEAALRARIGMALDALRRAGGKD